MNINETFGEGHLRGVLEVLGTITSGTEPGLPPLRAVDFSQVLPLEKPLFAHL
jgi:hypothetical protein